MDEPEDVERIEIRVYGMVQGVFFRHHTRLRALELAVSGTVENLPDGSVRVIAQGSQESLRALTEWLSHGPPLAHVERLVVKRSEPKADSKGFSILY